jgi:hypothetical protein
LSTAIIIVLAVLAIYLGRQWLSARAEVSELLGQIARLKRRLARSGR